jgi:hypothetical protein
LFHFWGTSVAANLTFLRRVGVTVMVFNYDETPYSRR